jgi:transcription antitermination factor NusG
VKRITLPLFPGYVFCRFAEDGRVPVLNTPGVRSVVCFGSQLAHLDDADVERIHQLAKSGLELQPLAGLRTGMRVDIVEGPLLGLTGVLSHVNGDARVVVNVHMLNRAVAVQVSPEAVAPCEHVLSAIPA